MTILYIIGEIDSGLQLNSGLTVFLIAAEHQTNGGFSALIDRVDSLDLAIISQDITSRKTLLHIAAYYQTSQVFMALISKVNRETLDRTLASPTKDGQTVLHIATVRKFPGVVFEQLMGRCSSEKLIQALTTEDGNGMTVMDIASPIVSICIMNHYLNKLLDIDCHQTPSEQDYCIKHKNILLRLLLDRNSVDELRQATDEDTPLGAVMTSHRNPERDRFFSKGTTNTVSTLQRRLGQLLNERNGAGRTSMEMMDWPAASTSQRNPSPALP